MLLNSVSSKRALEESESSFAKIVYSTQASIMLLVLKSFSKKAGL